MPGRLDYPTPVSPSILRREGAAVLWKRWRLLEGRELYDLATDPLQKTNVIEEQAGVAVRMRSHLDSWWAEVRDIANEPQAVTIGSDAEIVVIRDGRELKLTVHVDKRPPQLNRITAGTVRVFGGFPMALPNGAHRSDPTRDS